MVKLIIRDDDCNFFTRPEDLEHVYRSISDFPVTFAVVPEVTDVYGGCPDTMNNTIPRSTSSRNWKRVSATSLCMEYIMDISLIRMARRFRK